MDNNTRHNRLGFFIDPSTDNANQTAREQYKRIKIEFVKEKDGGIDEYTDYKEQFVSEIYGKRK